MGLRHDLTARLLQLSRPAYGKELLFEGADLPAPPTEKIQTRRGKVSCLVYDGTHASGGTYVHFHGGAFVMRHPKMDDFWARFVVATTGLTVVLPDYSVAPQVRYPVAHEQAHDVTAAYAERGPVVVGGFSAGGNLAAAVGLHRDLGLRGQLLGIPSVDIAEPVEEKAARVRGSMITPGLLTMVRATYFKDVSRRDEPGASPLRVADLSGLSPAFVVTAERDVLRPEGDAYAERLREAGNEVEHVVAPGVDHYFLHGAGPVQARALMDRMASWIAQRATAPYNAS